MMEKDDIKELFAKNLTEHQLPVDPSVWAAVSSSIATNTVQSSMGLLTKTLLGFGAAVVTITTIYFVYLSTTKETARPNQKAKIEKLEKTRQDGQTEINSPVINAHKNGSIKTNLNETSSEIQLNQFQNHLQNTPQIIEIDDSALPNASVHFSPLPSTNHTPVANTVNAATNFQNSQQTTATIVYDNPSLGPQNAAPTSAPKRAISKPTLPNIFTPNGDGQNDLLLINWKDLEVTDFSLVVLDQNNQVVYKSTQPDFKWDGTDVSGEKLTRGYYIYFVTARINGEAWQQSSSLQIQY